MNYYEHHISDYQKKTAHLSMIEHAAYFLMLQAFYATEKPLPAVKRVLYRIVRAESKPERAAVDTIVHEFWKETPAGLVNRRATAVLEGYRKFLAKQSASGKAGAEKRWGRDSESNGSAIATPLATPIAPTPTSEEERLQNYLSKITPTLPVPSSVRADPDQGSVCGNFKKVGAGTLNGTSTGRATSDYPYEPDPEDEIHASE